ncbi:MAG: holo-ACP synthase [Clostridia bacterium]|nr:holo-ACP synthase [Clostridia bacterium]
MKIYCGTDIIEVERIQEAIENTKEFKENIFSQNEIDDIDSIKCQMKYQRYAGRFAAKEAIYKAMSKILVENNLNMSFLDVEIENVEDLRKRPRINILNPKIKEVIHDLDIEIDLSISHIKENAIAMAVVKANKEE